MKCNLYKQQYSEKDPEKKGVRVGGVGGDRTERDRAAGAGEYSDTQTWYTKMQRTIADKERVRKKEISSVVIKMKNGFPATLNKS